MPLQPTRMHTKQTGGGLTRVAYRHPSGKTLDGKVLGEGSAPGLLNIELPSRYDGRVVLEDVPLCSTTKSTGCYLNRIS